jgi:SAM-dependent methyltransferase
VKALGLKLANVLAVVWRLLPQSFRHLFIKGLLVLESRGADAGQGLARLFALQDALEHVVNERAMVLGKGEHPKHRLTNYHRFFIDRLAQTARVLDVGCGYGAVARSIARGRPDGSVVGVDYDEERLRQAKAAENPPNLRFVLGDATQSVPDGPWDAIVLSNVLEHIADRVGLLRALKESTGSRQFLIRVPLFERGWQMAMRRELGANYYSDPDHKIEHRIADFEAEMAAAGLGIAEIKTTWGEIWADCRLPDDANAA